MKKSILSRVSKLTATTASIAAKELSIRLKGHTSTQSLGKILETRVAQAQDLVNSLSQLKGAAMKAGQWLSIEFGDLLPDEVKSVLRQLHDQSTPMSFRQVEELLKAAWKQSPDNVVTELSRQPIASASIGQVHKAKYQGKPIAIKIQFPGVANTIGSDLTALKRICQAYLAISGKTINISPLFEEITESLYREVDYEQEARFIKQYAADLSMHPNFIVPSVVDELSTTNVLALSFERGERIEDWLKRPLSPEDRAWPGTTLVELVTREFFTMGLVQSDPNFGNFLIRQEEQKVVLLDLGSCRVYDSATRRQVYEILQLAVQGDHSKLLEKSYEYHLLDRREKESVGVMYCELMDLIAGILSPHKQPFLFSDPTFLLELRTRSIEFAGAVQFTAPSKDLILLNRKLGGIFHLLKEARCSVDLHKIWVGIPQP